MLDSNPAPRACPLPLFSPTPASSDSNLSPDPCTGFYCPEGTGFDWQPCPPGTYGPVLGLSSLPGCQACDGGRFCPRANATEAGGQCWEGFFCSRGSTRPNPEAGTEGTRPSLLDTDPLFPFLSPPARRSGTDSDPSIHSVNQRDQ